MTAEAIPAEEFGYGLDVAGLDMAALGEALRDVVNEALADPVRMATWSAEVALAEQAIGMNFLRRFTGEEKVDPVAAPAAGDKRFAERAWRENPFLASILEAYLVRARAALRLVESSRLSPATRRKARFALTVLADAMAPTNVPWLNPAVVHEALDSGGASLMRGMQNFLEDQRSNEGRPRQVDAGAFEVGRNLAATPGRVVLRNELIELIAYDPVTPKVYRTPLLLSPPWINKYYIMDLAPGRSFAEWAVKQGHRVFAISYRNPDAAMASFTMDDYLRLGPLAALDAIERLTGERKVNIAALCLGGTLTLILLAYLAAKGEADRVGAVTLTNTLVDFSEPGDLGVFTDEATIARLEAAMAKHGFLEGRQMAGTFDWMRSNDLIWSYVVNNWFMGKAPPAFDILRWNADSTRMPATMHAQYLRTCYLRNALIQPGAVTMLDVPIDLGKIETPLYILGAEGDHIAPWRSSYATVLHVGSADVTYTLTNAGHVAGIVNPPGNPKASYWTKERASRREGPDGWRESAERHTGSWWEHWAGWMRTRAAKQITAPKPPPGEPAPGRYVLNETAPPFDATVPAAAS